MRRLLLSAGLLVMAAFLAVSAHAADKDRSVTLLQNTDLPGFDYQIDKNTTLPNCQQACVGDDLCRAFTFNTKSKWCFLKGDIGKAGPFNGATSGTLTLVPSVDDLAKTRTGDIPFPADDLIYSALGFAAGLPTTDAPPTGLLYPDLVKAGDDSAAQSDPASAMVAYRHALALNKNDPAVWLKLADQALVSA